ncbi:zinc finger CCCH domain-containing protein 6 isoform X1 [Hippocampus comes]|uniref:zinc finger CCCH domain-containing protein 6 isoform X1 n=1 Tax=Hippocampus comes TaxID=109280 RepID=UPI00094EEDF9|nr:PREDICTED: zinc finger CCCH domain-containing protein 6 isoform X1 [Hippocampus comes]
MASVSLVSSPPASVFDKNMTDSELAGDEREDGELEDGEIDDEGIGIEDENKESTEVTEDKEKPKEKEWDKTKEKEDKSHRHSRKRYKKTREKRRSKRRRRDRQKHHSSSSSSSSDSYDSDYDRPERPKNRPSHGSGRECDIQNTQHGRDQKASRGSMHKSPPHKSCNFDKYSDYSDNYEDEEDHYDDESEYTKSKDSTSGPGKGRYAKEQMGKRGNMRGMKHQFGQRGRGRGNGPGRVRGMLNKHKKMRGGKPWMGRGGRGRGVDQDMEDTAPDVKNCGFQKKRLIMSKEFISQHTVEHNGRYICKYFLEGRCIKGEQCKFEHELVIPDKKKELCKFYLQGYCSKGDHCIYMHSEYPCKFFHTGAKCYQGDNCKFSHDALTDVTKELLDKIINTEEENAREDELELEDLRKQGIAPLPKPPPGVGLLPTPGQSSPTDESSQGGKIPSLFEIKVQPTVDLAQKIAFHESNPQDPSECTDQISGGSEETQSGALVSSASDATTVPSLGSPSSGGYPTGPSMSTQSPPGQQLPHGYPLQQPILPGQQPVFRGNINHQMNMQRPPFPAVPELQMPQNIFPFPSMGQNPLELLSNLLQNQPVGHHVEPGMNQVQNLQQQIGPDLQLQSLPSAVQKAIILHLTQHQPESKPHESEPQIGESQDDKNTNRDETTNWYSSDEEGGSSVTSILKCLKRQSEMQQSKTPTPAPATPLGDPRLVKDRTQPSDPRVKVQRPSDMKKDSDVGLGPRLSRDPRKPRPMESTTYRQQNQPTVPKKATGDEDDEGERELRDRAVLIPLEASPGVVLRDPRCQLKQFSHIRVDILLQRPAFAQTVIWAPEDLIPSLIPKQEHSINLPLPPLIADAQMNKTSVSDHPPASSPPPTDPRLAAARLKERLARLPSGSSTERPVDPRQQKNLDPRIRRTGSLDSKLLGQKEATGGIVEPRLQKPSACSSLAERLPPYAPRLASSGGVLESPTAILGGISLYDPRNQTEPFQKDQAEPPKKAGILKHPVKKDGPPTQPDSPSQGRVSLDETKTTDAASDHDSLHPPPQDSIITPYAVHNLPMQALAGLIRPQYTDGRQAKLAGSGSAGALDDAEEEKEQKEVPVEAPKQLNEEELEDRTLKEVFKTFDPTASPFSQ